MRASPAGTWRPERVYPPAAEEFAELRRRDGRPETPAVAFVTAGRWFDPAHPALDERAIVLTTKRAAEMLQPRVPSGCEVVAVNDGDRVDLRDALACLHERGHSRVLSEAGPTLFGSLLAAGVVDELFVTISPQLAGRDSQRRLAMVEGLEMLPEATTALRLLSTRRHANHLFVQYAFI
jgi:riboflavin biosynthesis pyrimidine reductase